MARNLRNALCRAVVGAVLGSMTPGCSNTDAAEPTSGDSGSGSPTSTSTTGDPQTSTADTSGNADAPDAASDGDSSGEDSGGNGQGAMCDLFDQDCATGLKCAYHCVGVDCRPSCRPVTGDGALGDPCTANGLEADSPDDCGEDTLCWTGEAEPGEGICAPFCTGSPAAPMCDEPDEVCAQQTVCLPRCDPIVQGCPDGQGCFDVDFGAFVCWNTADIPIPTGEVCAGNTLCEPGSMCVFADDLTGCTGARCCTPYCDLGEPDPCPAIDPSLVCVPYGTEHPTQGHVGVCILPS